MPSESDLDLDVLMEAMDRYADAKRAHDKALSKYDGYSWGYFGQTFIEALDEARKEVRSKLSEYVRGEVKAAIEAMMSPED
jgi:hypothetical protein